jgi:hypothetical protein
VVFCNLSQLHTFVKYQHCKIKLFLKINNNLRLPGKYLKNNPFSLLLSVKILKMNNFLENLVNILYHNILVHIYSSPNFIMETCISVLMCIIHCLLIVEINNIIKQINVPPLKIRIKQSLAGKQFVNLSRYSFHSYSQ